MAPLRRLLALACLVPAAACAGRTARVTPAPTPEATVGQFLAAVNANDLERMARLFGDERGRAAWGNATQRQQRLSIMQHLLVNDSSRVVGTEPDSAGVTSRRLVYVDVMRGDQRVRVPFVAAQQRSGGWLVFAIGVQALMPSLEGRRSP